MSNMTGNDRALTYAEMRDQNLFTDTVIKSSSGREWNVHRVVMSRASRFFSNAFTFPSFSGTLDLGVSDVVVEVIVDLAYEGTCDVNAENVLEILSAALMYQIQSLIEICLIFVLKNTISAENVLDLKVFVRDHKVSLETFTNGALIQTVDKFIRRNFIDLYERDEVYTLSIEELDGYIIADDLNIAEEELLSFVLKYIAFHQLNLEKARQLLSNVRLVLIDPDKLQQTVDENETFRTLMETRGDINTDHIPRYPRDIVLVSRGWVGGEKNMFEVFNIRKNEWKEVLLIEIGPEIILGNILYSINFFEGPEAGMTKISSFDIKNGSLDVTEKLCKLPSDFDIFYADLLAWNGGILAFMSNDTDLYRNVAYYNPEENSWAPFPSTNGAVSVVVNGNLFSIGRYFIADPNKDIEYFDSDSKSWVLCGHLKETPFTEPDAIVVDGKVYAFPKCGDYIECFQPVWADGRMNLVWFPNIQLPFVYETVETSVVDNKIMFTGGVRFDDDDFDQRECHIFSPKTGEWSRTADLHNGKKDHKAITINTSEFEVSRIQELCDGQVVVWDDEDESEDE